jgi:hypothetical protein
MPVWYLGENMTNPRTRRAILLASGATAKVYYVDATLGLDTNSGLTTAAPWQTIAKVNAATLNPGESVLFKRGETWAALLNITRSGSAGHPIVFSCYGSGALPKIDGTGLDVDHSEHTALVTIAASYVTFSNFEVCNADWYGIFNGNWDAGQSFNHVIISGNNVHDTWQQGILSFGNYNLINTNQVHRCGLVSAAHDVDWPGSIAVGSTTYADLGHHTIVSNNQVYQNVGEGILSTYTHHITIIGNRCWDNWAMHIYPDQVSYMTISGNFCYYTSDTTYKRFSGWSFGIYIANEGIIAGYAIGHDRLICNNITVNCHAGIDFTKGGAAGSCLTNDTITNNTVITLTNTYDAIIIRAPETGCDHSGTVITNNLIRAASGSDSLTEDATGITWSNNFWAVTPPASAQGTSDITADPLLVNPTQTIELDQIATPLDAGGYKLTSLSTAIGASTVVAGVTTDYFGTIRNVTAPDRGAHEFVA